MAATKRSRTRAWPASAPGRGWPGAALFATVNAVLAAVGHHLASEEPVPWARLFLVTAAVFLISVPGARRPCGLTRTVLSTLLAQGVLHQGLVVPHSHSHSAGASTGYAAHAAPWLMALAHVTAAVATAVLLHRVDQRLRGLSTVMVRWARATAVALARATGFSPYRTLGSPTADGYTVGGTALKTGVDAKYSVVVKQLPDAKSLAFKTVETYEDGKISRWIEVPSGGQKVETPAPVLDLKPAAPGAKPLAPSPSPTPSAAPSSAAPTPSPEPSVATSAPSTAEKKDEGGSTGVIIGIIVAVLVIGAGAGMWFKRRSTNAG
ncbi:DUF1775 domain-containing protein [Streptomyces sp. 4.24]|uniref:DUF1775 domain-containing protein n=1 Tax=Streptomyces tritrimontium TaxID=3406573 RepID=UPI003BB600F9